QEIDVVALEDFLVSLVEQGDAQTKHAAIALALEPRHLELRVDGVAEQDGLAEPAPLLDEGDHGGLETLGVGGGAESGHRHDEEPMGDASAESRVAGVAPVAMDGVGVGREAREEEEVRVAQCAPGAPESLPEREVIEIELAAIVHGFAILAELGRQWRSRPGRRCRIPDSSSDYLMDAAENGAVARRSQSHAKYLSDLSCGEGDRSHGQPGALAPHQGAQAMKFLFMIFHEEATLDAMPKNEM